MDLKEIDLNKLQDYAFTANEIVMSSMTSWNSKFINIKCLDNESIIPTVKAIPLAKVKQAREEIQDDSFAAYGEYDDPQSYYEVIEIEDVLKVLDKLIAESED